MKRLLAVCLCSLTTMLPAVAGEVLLRPGDPLDQRAVERLLAEPLAAATAADAVRIGIREPALPLTNPYASDAELRLADLTLLPRDRFVAEVVIRTGAAAPMRLTLTGDVVALVAVPVPRNPLPSGAVIDAADLDVAFHAEARLRGDWVREAADLVGLQTHRPLAAGRPVVQAAVRAPTVIRRGDEVTLLYRRGAMTLEAVGRAQRDGALGERIPARNPATGTVVEGRVVDAHTLLLEAAR